MISFEIPALPKRINQSMGKSWQVYHAERLKWRKWVYLATTGQRPKEPLKKARLRLIRVSSMCPDHDGLVQSMKVVIDALKHCGIIEDDSMAHIGAPEYQWLKGKPKHGKIIVSVYPIDN